MFKIEWTTFGSIRLNQRTSYLTPARISKPVSFSLYLVQFKLKNTESSYAAKSIKMNHTSLRRQNS